MKNIVGLIIVILSFYSCEEVSTGKIEDIANTSESTGKIIDSINFDNESLIETLIPLDSFFVGIDTNFSTQELIIPSNLRVKILFTEQLDNVVNHLGKSSPAKKDHDMISYMPIDGSSEHGWLYVGHENRYRNDVLGDGGGATMFEIRLQDGEWNVISDFQNVDFTGVRGTNNNCGGSLAPNGKIYTCEESVPQNNRALYINGNGHTDTSDVGNLRFNENFGYIVEVDPITKKATQKMIQMGRYYHEDLEFMDDRKTVYLSDDYEPCIFYKFIANKEDDYSQGQLYAYTQKNGQGDWIKMPMDTASLVNCRDEAINRGAAMLMRHEWFARIGDNIYIAETGHDSTNWSHRIAQGGVVAHHLEKDHAHGNGIYTDYFGRVLVFDTKTNQMKVLLEGGKGRDGKTVLSNPDCISTVNLGGKDYLFIHEDINGNGYGRVPSYAFKKNKWFNELYFLDLSIENPTVDDLVRFAVTPMGAEFTGGIFSPDGKSMFLNIQHPYAKNKTPYNKSMTIVITGW